MPDRKELEKQDIDIARKKQDDFREQLKVQAVKKRSEEAMMEVHQSMTKRNAYRQAQDNLADKKWEELTKRGKDLCESEQMGFDTFTGAISKLIGACYLLADTLETTELLGSLIDGLYNMSFEVNRQTVCVGFEIEKLIKQYSESKREAPKVKLPEVGYSAEYKDNKLKFDMVRSDAKEVGEELKDMIQLGTHAWLRTCGFDPVEHKPGCFVSVDDGHELMPEEFKTMMADEEHGLASYLSGNFDIKFRERAAPSP